MHVFISDTHMTDMKAGSPVTDAELSTFADELRKLSNNEQVTLVILGDGVDLLRSRKWDRLAKDNVFPWSAMAKGFPNFLGNRPEDTALTVLKGIRKHYPIFERKIKDLVSQNGLEVRYIVGNHDYMLQLSSSLRYELAEFLSLADDPNDPFPLVFEDEQLSIHAQHGHRFDPINWHDEENGYWAFGDAIVLRVINRFAEVASKRLGVTPATPLGRMLQELDNVSPTMDLPVFVRWSASNLTHKAQRRQVFKAWETVVKDLLDDNDLKLRGHPDRDTRTALAFVRKVLHFSRNENADKVVNFLWRDFLRKKEEHDPYRWYAETRAAELKKYRYILFGHTHTPKIVPLTQRVGEHSCLYVNTGCWRQVWARPDRSEPGPFVPIRVAAHFQIGTKADSTKFVYYGKPIE